MKPIIRCSSCENDLRLGDQHCSNCGQSVEWPEDQARMGKAGRKGDRGAGDQRKKTAGTGLSSTGKLVTGIAVLVVGGAVVLTLLIESPNQPQSASGQMVTPPQVPLMGQPGPNMQAATQLTELENRVRQNPENHELALEAANFAHDNGYFEKAIAYYDQYLGRHPDDVNAIVDKGICFHELKRSEEAIAIMNQALKIQPKHLQANFNLGIINLQQGNIAKANEWFTKVVTIAPNSEISKRAQELLAPHANLPPQQ